MEVRFTGLVKLKNKKDVEELDVHKKAFRIDDWHFNKATFYKLTPLGISFYGNLDYNQSLSVYNINQADNYKIQLSKKHRELKDFKDKE